MTGVTLARQFGGYLLSVPPGSVDVHRLAELVADDQAAEALPSATVSRSPG